MLGRLAGFVTRGDTLCWIVSERQKIPFNFLKAKKYHGNCHQTLEYGGQIFANQDLSFIVISGAAHGKKCSI